MKILKKITRFLVFNDWIWSVLLAFVMYWILNNGPAEIGGVPMTYYAVNWVQALFATAGAMAGLYGLVRVGLWFNKRVIHNYIWRRKDSPGDQSSINDYSNITPWQRILLSMAWLAFFFSLCFILFLQFLKMQGAG